ncbi:MAG: EVE domain-containing protein [Opitutaceae bacterium]|nr:EVE domain-containing protein [Opitutaceae bacterium]
MTTQYWLVKSEPAAYAWADLVRDGRTAWAGVRNYQARIHLKAMRPGDRVFFYESVTTKAVIGIAEITRPAFPDATAGERRLPASGGAKGAQGWVAVELKAVQALPRAVTLAQIKADPALTAIALLRQGRLSVVPLARAEFERIVKLGS